MSLHTGSMMNEDVKREKEKEKSAGLKTRHYNVRIKLLGMLPLCNEEGHDVSCPYEERH